jgi:hypothetical protein
MQAPGDAARGLTLGRRTRDRHGRVTRVVEAALLHDDLTAHVHSAGRAVWKLQLHVTERRVDAGDHLVDQALPV